LIEAPEFLKGRKIMKKQNTATERPKEKVKLGDIIVNILLVLSLCLLGAAIIVSFKFKENPEEAFLFGYKPVYILTGSMEPTLKEKGVCIVKKCTYDEVDVDDILMYQIEDKTITHRVVEKTNDGIRTKGDNNDVQDAYLLGPENVKAKVVIIFNFTSTIINDLNSGFMGYVKWVIFPVFVILVICFVPKLIKKIWSMPDDEFDKKISAGKVKNKKEVQKTDTKYKG